MNTTNAENEIVRIERIMRAPPERVYRAFLDPELLERWLGPGELIVGPVTVDARVGGKIVAPHSMHGASSGSFEGVFVKMVPNRELVYRWAFLGTEPEKGEYFDTLVHVVLRPAPGGKTRLTVVHEKLEELRRGVPEIAARLVPGWTEVLGKMEDALVR